MTNKKTKLAPLKFTKLSEKKARDELNKFLEDTVQIKLSTKLSYSIKFLNRSLIFSINKQFASSLFKQVTSKIGILGIIMEYDRTGNTYFADKLVLCKPKSEKEIFFEITNLSGTGMYSGVGKVKNDGIHFKIRGKPIEGTVRSTISGIISQTSIKFKKSTMPNKFYKKRNIPKKFNPVKIVQKRN